MWEKLQAAIREKNIELAIDLINIMEHSEFDKRDGTDSTLLMQALQRKLEEVSKLLITKMSDEAINVVCNGGYTALTLAIISGNNEICELLIPKMSTEAINAIDGMGWTSLTRAASYNMKQICELLIPKMSTEAINTINMRGKTALSYAAEQGMKEVCELLILKMNDAAINAIDDAGCTALSYAAEAGKKEVCELLIPEMSDAAINAIDSKGRTALIWTIKNGIDEVSVRLIYLSNEKSLNSAAKNYYEDIEFDGNTALSTAVYKGNAALSKILTPLMSVEAINASKIYKMKFIGTNLLKYTLDHNQINLLTMLYTKVEFDYHNAFKKSLNGFDSSTDKIKMKIENSLFQIVKFIIESFTTSDSNESEIAEIKFEDFGKLKSYQQINRDLFKSCLDHSGEDGASLMRKVDTYIAIKYFTIAGISPSISLPEDPANHVFSFLEFPSLLAINTYEANAVTAVGELSSDALSGA